MYEFIRSLPAGETDLALLLALAIAHAEDRALKGEAPGPPADFLRTTGDEPR